MSKQTHLVGQKVDVRIDGLLISSKICFIKAITVMCSLLSFGAHDLDDDHSGLAVKKKQTQKTKNKTKQNKNTCSEGTIVLTFCETN